ALPARQRRAQPLAGRAEPTKADAAPQASGKGNPPLAAKCYCLDMTVSDTHPWSAGFRGLAEEHSYRLDDIEGVVPARLRGMLFRNGSGRNELGGRWFAHWFDGDGMIVAFRFDDQGIHFQNRYVATRNYRDETRAGRILYRGFGKMVPG